jgi:excisionase family DNA binding protein
MPITEDDVGELLSPLAAADFLHVTRSTIYRMIQAGEIDVTHVGTGRGRVKITKRALLDHLNRKTTRASSTPRRPGRPRRDGTTS